MAKIKDTEYMYASAKIRAAEGKDTPRARIDRLAECRTVPALLAAVCDLGFLEDGGAVPATLEDALRMALDHAVALVQNAVPEPEIYNFLLYKYDCSNLKVALKASILGRDYSELYFRCGTFPVDELSERLAAQDFTGIPTHMAQAYADARDTYAKTGEVRAIDLLLDHACFADIADNVQKYQVPLFVRYAAARADLTNLQTAQRLSTGHAAEETAAALFKRAYVPGGTLPAEIFFSDEGHVRDYEALTGVLEDDALRELLTKVLSDRNPPDGAFDNYAYRLFAELRHQPFGVEIPFWFLVVREAEIKNCRLIEAGLYAGLKPEEIRERIRVDYV